MNVAIIGCGYVGYAVAKFWRQNPNFRVTVTTTSEYKVSTLQEVADAVEVTRGDDQVFLNRVLENQDVVLLAVGAKSSSSYEKTYLETA
ncbi:saccharopine dehydrogenase NADP-binding domain-containing protein, partial [Cylindrospermopsis raciborskii]